MSDNMAGLDTFDVGYAAAKAECAAELSDTQQKLEAAEARIEASQEQEPVKELEIYPVGTKFYTAPVIPPDIAELKRENAELTRKLAEQQAYLDAHEAPEFLSEFGREELTKLLAEAKSEAVPEGMVLIRRDVVEFLNGSGCNDDGLWFGEDNPDTPGKFWWRRMLPKLAASPQPGGSNE